jgi:pimeloyl-ACP methyl ester carboxylesterase
MPTIQIADYPIHYLHHVGSAGRGGKRVLYVHGTGCNAQVFSRHMLALGETHEVAAIDLPGHGLSGGTGFRGVADYAAYCADLIRALGWTDCVVAGHSLGGGIALALALYDAPLVHALILIDSGARLRVGPEIIKQAEAFASTATLTKGNSRRGFAADTTDAVIAELRAMTDLCDAQVIVKDWVAADTCDFIPRLAAIKIPTLAICGLEDTLTPPKYHEFLTEKLANCTLAVLEGAGHWPFVEQTAIFDQHVRDFLVGC